MNKATIFGGIEEKVGNAYLLALSSNDVAGFSQDFQFTKRPFHEENLTPIDLGLNSPFEIDLQQLETDLKSLLNTVQE